MIIEAQSVGNDAESFQLAEFADGVIMTVETELTTRSDAADRLNRLDRLGTTVLGAAVFAASGRIRPPAQQDPADRVAAVPEPQRLPASAPRSAADTSEETRPLSRVTAMSGPDRGGPASDVNEPTDKTVKA